VIEPHLDVASLALVGHEPNLSELASILLTGRPTSLAMEIKKGGAAHLWLNDGLRRGRRRFGGSSPRRCCALWAGNREVVRR
jgi:phosphohistidine phosphatase SixA